MSDQNLNMSDHFWIWSDKLSFHIPIVTMCTVDQTLYSRSLWMASAMGSLWVALPTGAEGASQHRPKKR